MPEETSQNNTQSNSWFSDISWKTAIILSTLAFISGGTGGTALVASKGVQSTGMGQDQADLRYLSQDEAKRLRQSRDAQIDAVKNELKLEIERTLKKETFDIWLQTWNERQKNFDDKLDRILEK